MHGIQNARIENIARRADVTKQVIYYNFTSKLGLYEAVFHDISEKCFRKIAEQNFSDMNPLDGIILLFATIYELHVEMPFLTPMGIDLHFQEAMSVESVAAFRKVIILYNTLVDGAIAKGVIDPTIDKARTYATAMLILRGSFVRSGRAWTYHGDAAEIEDSGPALRSNVLNAIRTIFSASVRRPAIADCTNRP